MLPIKITIQTSKKEYKQEYKQYKQYKEYKQVKNLSKTRVKNTPVLKNFNKTLKGGSLVPHLWQIFSQRRAAVVLSPGGVGKLEII